MDRRRPRAARRRDRGAMGDGGRSRAPRRARPPAPTPTSTLTEGIPMSDTSRLKLVLEGQNLSEQAFRRASQDLQTLGLNVTRVSAVTRQGMAEMQTATTAAQRTLSGLGAGLAQG